MNKQELLGWLITWYVGSTNAPKDGENEAFKTIFELIYAEAPDEEG